MSDKGIVVDVSLKKISVESYRDKPCGLCGKMPEEAECKNPAPFNN